MILHLHVSPCPSCPTDIWQWFPGRPPLLPEEPQPRQHKPGGCICFNSCKPAFKPFPFNAFKLNHQAGGDATYSSFSVWISGFRNQQIPHILLHWGYCITVRPLSVAHTIITFLPGLLLPSVYWVLCFLWDPSGSAAVTVPTWLVDALQHTATFIPALIMSPCKQKQQCASCCCFCCV